jgi:hypothetical protein
MNQPNCSTVKMEVVVSSETLFTVLPGYMASCSLQMWPFSQQESKTGRGGYSNFLLSGSIVLPSCAVVIQNSPVETTSCCAVCAVLLKHMFSCVSNLRSRVLFALSDTEERAASTLVRGYACKTFRRVPNHLTAT